VRPTMAVRGKNLTVDSSGGVPGRNSQPIGRCWTRPVVQVSWPWPQRGGGAATRCGGGGYRSGRGE
jgi:hypothetical protein